MLTDLLEAAGKGDVAAVTAILDENPDIINERGDAGTARGEGLCQLEHGGTNGRAWRTR
jgi:hypothetical protein